VLRVRRQFDHALRPEELHVRQRRHPSDRLVDHGVRAPLADEHEVPLAMPPGQCLEQLPVQLLLDEPDVADSRTRDRSQVAGSGTSREKASWSTPLRQRIEFGLRRPFFSNIFGELMNTRSTERISRDSESSSGTSTGENENSSSM